MNALLLTLLASLTAHAGASDRGGGNALVCFDDSSIPKNIRDKSHPDFGVITNDELRHITKIEMLDLVQARMFSEGEGEREIELVPVRQNESPQKYAERIMGRIGYYAPFLYDRLNDGREALQKNTFFASEGVALVDDASISFNFDRKLCVIATMAAQESENEGLFVDKRLYSHEKHSVQSRGVMFLHEWTYFTLLKKKKSTNSAGVRMVLARLLRNGYNSLRELITAAAKAKLLAAPDEKYDDQYNGLQVLHARAWEFYKKIYLDIMPKWLHIDEENSSSNEEYFWPKFQELGENLQGLPVMCIPLGENCVKELERVIAESTWPENVEKAKRALPMVKDLSNQFKFSRNLATNIEFIQKVFYKTTFTDRFCSTADCVPLPEFHVQAISNDFARVFREFATKVERDLLWETLNPRAHKDYATYKQKTSAHVQKLLREIEEKFQEGYVKGEGHRLTLEPMY